jgi:anti-sigma factor RsiW
MNCDHCEELISDYLEGVLSPADRASIDSHLTTCPGCNDMLAAIRRVFEWGKSFPLHEAPARLHARLAAIPSVPVIACGYCEELMSDYLESVHGPPLREAMDAHFAVCDACAELRAGVMQVRSWAGEFPVYDAPPWLPVRIAAAAPRVERERWIDTVAGAFRWIRDPRAAIGLFTATLVLSWMGSLAGISPGSWTTVVRNPAGIYYDAQGALNHVYDEAVRKYYRSPLISEIRTRIEQLREIS